MSNDLVQALNDIEKERGIPKRALVEAIKSALALRIRRILGLLRM